MTLKTFLVLLVLVISSAEATSRELVTFYTGGVRGTYYKFAEDLKRACPNFQIQNVETDGSIQNLNALISSTPVLKTGARFAFIQEDTANAAPASMKRVISVMGLYREDISLIVSVKSSVKKLSDLTGLRVSVGIPGSGVWFTSNAIQKHLGVRWRAVERSPEESILQLLTGDLDAMIIVGGHPLKMLNELGESMKKHIRMVNLDSRELEGLYGPSELPAKTYPWQDSAVELRATRSLLIAAGDVPPSTITALTSCISANIIALRRWGHPKWNEVQTPLK